MATYPFVASATDLGIAKGPRLAIAWHMAEGGGTVGYLSRPNPNGVSVHFVIEKVGRIVQMLDVTHMHSSLRTSDIRLSDDADGFYGRTHALAVMGDWADIAHGTSGPNHASIGVEMEGFAAIGPNDDQVAAMAVLWHDLSTRYPNIRSLAHRDFQDYKACPGRQIPWAVVGGHGAAKEDAPMDVVQTRRVAHAAGEHGIFDHPVADKARLVRNIAPGGEVVRILGNSDPDGWQLIETTAEPFARGWIANGPKDAPYVTGFDDEEPDADAAELADWHAWYAQAPVT